MDSSYPVKLILFGEKSKLERHKLDGSTKLTPLRDMP